MDTLTLCLKEGGGRLPRDVIAGLVFGDGPVTLAMLALVKGWTTEYEFDVAHFKEITEQGHLIGFQVEIPDILDLEIGIKLDSEHIGDDQARGKLRKVNGVLIEDPRQICVLLTRAPTKPTDLITVGVDRSPYPIPLRKLTVDEA